MDEGGKEEVGVMKLQENLPCSCWLWMLVTVNCEGRPLLEAGKDKDVDSPLESPETNTILQTP